VWALCYEGQHQQPRPHEPDGQQDEWGAEGQGNFAYREIKTRHQHRKYRKKQQTRFAHATKFSSL